MEEIDKELGNAVTNEFFQNNQDIFEKYLELFWKRVVQIRSGELNQSEYLKEWERMKTITVRLR